MKRFIALFSVLALVTLLLGGCGSSQEEAKSMEQIYSEQGVPVRTEKIKLTGFEDKSTHNAVLSGIEESSAYAMISDKVDKVHFRVGDYVKKDDVVISFPTDNPAAQYYQAKVAYENAESAFKRIEELYSTGGISQQEMDNAQASYRVSQANWDAVRQSVSVRAPIGGVLTKVNVRESDNVQPDDELFTVSRTEKMKAKLWISDKEISRFKPGLPAFAIWNEVRISGKVVQVDMSINKERQAFGVTVEFDNLKKIPLTGMVVVVSVDLYTNPEAVVVERKNILMEEDKAYVFVVRGETAEKRYVTLGNNHGVDIEVTGGLAPGEMLITEGQMYLKDGAPIRIVNDSEENVSK
jgi:membrane fusion protein (multidrug efflux system)